MSLTRDIRALLLQHPDGLTVPEMLRHLPDVHLASVHSRLHSNSMADVYVDRWVPSTAAGGYSPVFVAVPIPADAPKPDRKR